MKPATNTFAFLESLELRIAPASLAGIDYKAITLGTPQLLKAGEGLSTSENGTGSLLVAVEKGQMLVFTTDLNGNGRFDPNEITGIAAGDGLRFTSFVDINGDIVTNLQADGKLSDSDGDPSNGRDGKVLLNSRIENITLRSVTAADLPVGVSVENRIALSSYSIHGFIYAGNGIGGVGSAESLGVDRTGIIIDTSGITAQIAKFSGGNIDRQIEDVLPNIGGIKVGTAASGSVFSFGYQTTGPDAGSVAVGYGGKLMDFVPQIGQSGGDVVGLRVGANAALWSAVLDPTPFTIGFILAGNGGIGARGGNIENVSLMGDTGGVRIVAGHGGDGINGGAGGSIINLSDFGSYNSVVEIRAGNGGEGFLGTAGAAGNVSFGKWVGNGQIVIGLGNGGNGLTQGGNGTGIATGDIQPTDNPAPTPVGIISTWRPDDSISPIVADFNNDGFADMLFMTDNPNKLGIRFGSALGIDVNAPTLYFNSPVFATPDLRSSGVVIGDFNGDGLLDIAAASSRENASDGLRIFLNDGTWFAKAQPSSASQGGNYIADYIHVALPYLPSTITTAGFEQHRRGFAITDMVVGDFNDDGITDIAYLMQGLAITAVNPNRTNLVVLEGLGDGRFFANFGYDMATDTRTNSPFAMLYSGASGWDEVHIKSSVTTEFDTSTSKIVTARVSDTKFIISDYNTTAGTLTTANLASGSFRQSWPDPDPTKPPPSITSPAHILGFTILDIGQDGQWDMVALNESNALTTFAFAATPIGLAFDQGVALTGSDQTLFGSNQTPQFFAITTGDFDGDPLTSEIALLGDDPAPAGWSFRVIEISGTNIYTDPSTLTATSTAPALSPTAGTYAAFDVSSIPGGPGQGFIVAGDTTGSPPPILRTPGLLGAPILSLLNTNSLLLVAGSGGNSRLGSGGNGGGFGGGSLELSALKIVQPKNDDVQLQIIVQGGVGGSGFVNGGHGGGVSGFSHTFATGTTLLAGTVYLFGGTGGSALLGTGGSGGSLTNFFTERGIGLVGGNGGSGMVGGAGGNVQPNTLAGGVSNVSSSVTVITGAGGRGVTAGGAGGNLTGFFNEFRQLALGQGGLLSYTTGAGGDALAGRAGAGGAIINSSPYQANNNLVGIISLRTGAGGNGLIGGAGGAITNFNNTSTVFDVPSILDVLAGNGGKGTAGNGGNGGNITNFVGSATGLVTGGNQFNRVIAGDGGAGFGGQGGAGGILSGIRVTANSSAMAIAAGAGGDGLTRGGVGGSVLNSSADSAGGVDGAKVVVFAGNGGSAFAALATGSNVAAAGTSPAILALRAFGNAAGVGGNGGSITGFTQPKTVGAAVDLIAGNGGSLINYGSPSDASTNVGTGGSISKVNLTGNAGRIASNVAIVSYGPNFVQSVLRDSPGVQLTNSIGNVGVVVGEAGRVRGGLPAGDGAAKAGSVSDFTANNIMSMVAGSVDRIAAIKSISGITVSPGGILGAYKNTPVAHAANSTVYFAADGVTQVPTPVLGGKLMDGAIVTQNNNAGIQGSRIFSV